MVRLVASSKFPAHLSPRLHGTMEAARSKGKIIGETCAFWRFKGKIKGENHRGIIDVLSTSFVVRNLWGNMGKLIGKNGGKKHIENPNTAESPDMPSPLPPLPIISGMPCLTNVRWLCLKMLNDEG